MAGSGSYRSSIRGYAHCPVKQSCCPNTSIREIVRGTWLARNRHAAHLPEPQRITCVMPASIQMARVGGTTRRPAPACTTITPHGIDQLQLGMRVRLDMPTGRESVARAVIWRRL
jgi:hypothetical protein